MASIILGLIRVLGSVVIVLIISVSVIIIKFMDDNSLDCDDVINMLREINNIEMEEGEG